MIRFLFGVIVGIVIFFFFIYFGGGKAVKKIGEGLTDTGKKIEVLEDIIRREKEVTGKEIQKEIQKKFSKEEKEVPKKGQ